MWIADGWKEYQVLDSSGGEKLEQWGDYILLRPDPQVIWNTEKKIPEWKKLNAHYHRSWRRRCWQTGWLILDVCFCRCL